MGSDERSSGEQYPGPDPAKSRKTYDAVDAAPGEHGHDRGQGGPVDGVDESVEVGDAVASFGPRLGRVSDAPGSGREDEDRDSPAKTEDADW